MTLETRSQRFIYNARQLFRLLGALQWYLEQTKLKRVIPASRLGLFFHVASSMVLTPAHDSDRSARTGLLPENVIVLLPPNDTNRFKLSRG